MLGIGAALTFIKSIPGMIVAGLLAALLGYMAFLKIENGSLETSLAKTQAAAAVLKQSNTTLELDNRKKQQEFNAAILEQQNTTRNDQEIADKAQKARDAAQALSRQQQEVLDENPEVFLKQINRDIGCDFQGFGKSMTCDTLKEPTKEK